MKYGLNTSSRLGVYKRKRYCKLATAGSEHSGVLCVLSVCLS